MPLNVALVGAGNISRGHLTALRVSRDATVVGIYDADRSRADQRATEFAIPRIYSSWEELLGDPNVQIVGVLLPPDLHHRFTVDALAAGKHVVCEKPMAASLEECDDMIAVAQRAGRRLFIVQNRIYSKAYEAAREYVVNGAIGTVFLAQTTGFEGPNTVWRSPWLATGRGGNGVLMAQSVHPMYTLRWFFGDVEQVSCTVGTRKVIDMVEEDTAVVTLRFTSGVLAEMTATFGLKNGPFDHGIFIYGDEGYIEIRNRSGGSNRAESLQVLSPREYGDSEIHDVEVTAPASNHSQFQFMWEDYLHAIESNGAARVAAVDGRNAVEVILAAHRSNDLGQVVKLPLKKGDVSGN